MENNETNSNELRERNMKMGMLESASLGMLEALEKRKHISGEINEKREEIIALLEELGITDHHFTTDDLGEEKLVEMVITSQMKSRLNKKELAETLGVERGELDTRGMVELSESGTLTTEIFQEHIEQENKTKLTLKKKRKAKPKKEKE